MNTNDTLFWSAIGAAVGSFAGIIIFFLFRLLIEWVRSGRKLITTYLCASEQNQGQPTESEGELMHHHGMRIADAISLKLFDVKSPIWQWTRTPVGRGTGDSTIYGPYTTDFDEPAMYSVVFRIRAVGLSRPQEIIKDLILIELDVNSTTPNYTPIQTQIITFGAQRKVARKYVRTSQLAKGGWQDFELRFYSDGQGAWEYRVLAYDGLAGRPNNLQGLGEDVRILFEKVSIYKLKKMTLPWT